MNDSQCCESCHATIPPALWLTPSLPCLQLLDLQARLYNPLRLTGLHMDRDYIVSIYKKFVAVMSTQELSTDKLDRWVLPYGCSGLLFPCFHLGSDLALPCIAACCSLWRPLRS